MSDYKPWEEYPHIWKTEAAFLSFLRGGIRRYLWSKNPVKLEFEKESTIKIRNTNPKSLKKFPYVNGFQCAHCSGMFKSNEVQCDHKTGEHALRSLDDLQSFVEGIVLVKKEDLQMLCKPCHNIKTYAEREGMSLEDAKAHKQAIEMNKKSVKIVVDFLSKSGIMPAKTKDKRREQLVQYFKENPDAKG